MVLERGWPLVLPLVLVAGLSSPSPGSACSPRLPDAARLVTLAVFALVGLACLYPLRFFRMPGPQEIDRRSRRRMRCA